MKKIEAIIREEKLQEVMKELEAEGFFGLTVSQVSGRGQQKGISLQWRAGEYKIDLLPKLKLEIVCHDGRCIPAVDAIRRAAKTGRIGDGKIFILPVENAVRIRTGEDGVSVI